MYLIEILLPKSDHAGRQFPADVYDDIRQKLTHEFGGATAFLREPAAGLWKDAEGTVQADEIIIVEVMTESLDRQWWAGYRSELEVRFRQEEIVVRAMALERL